MTWTAWNNGKRRPTGAGYGFKVDAVERDRNFEPDWQSITVELPAALGDVAVEVNVNKQSFWGDCRELISDGIGRWMLDEGYAPWPKRRPPRFDVAPSGARRFRVKALAGAPATPAR